MQLRVDPSNEWETLIRAGCFSCLRDALARLDAAAVRQNSPDLARAAFSTAALLLVRARELGLPEGHFLERARFWSDHIKLSSRQLPPSAFFDALALIQGDTMGLPPSERERRAVEHRVRWTTDGSAPPARAALSPFVGDDVVAEYVALTLDCENGQALTPWERERVLARHPIPVIQFRLHVCAADERGLRTLLETDDRWVDTLAIRGRLAMVRYPSPNLVEAARLLGAAHREFARSDSISLALAAAQNALADRHVDAVATATVLIDLGTEHVSDGWYWRAWNRYQLQQLPDAWRDVTNATSSGGNASAYLLAGVIAYARQWRFTAIDRLHTAYAMDSTQCEAVWIEALVHVDQEDWRIAGGRFAIAVDCFGDAADQAKRQLNAALGASHTDSNGESRPERIATEQLASAEWRLAQSAYNAASSYARAGDKNIALRYLAIAASHPLIEDKSDELKRQILKHEPAPR
jgi:hypothetical protein